MADSGWVRGLILACAAAVLATACGVAPDKKEEPPRRSGPLYFPPLPEQPRFVYEFVLRDADSLPREENEQERLRRLLTGDDPQAGKMRKPFSVAARQGRIYVTDTEARRVHVFDVPRRRFFSFGVRFEGELRKPGGIAVDAQSKVYVADTTARRVVAYDPLGLYLKTIGTQEDLERPVSVAVNPEGSRIYVLESGGPESARHLVVAYNGDGRKLFEIGARGAEHGQFNYPVDASVAPDGTLYVLDAGNFRVQAFDSDGKFLRAFGSVGNGLGQFSRPRGIATDREGNVYVTDAGFANIQVFDSEGRLLLPIGSRGENDGPSLYSLPAGIASDETGRIYVVDQFFHKIEVLRRIPDEEGKRILSHQPPPARP